MDEPDVRVWMPLFEAIASHKEETSKVLLAHSVEDIDQQDVRGW